MSETVQKVKQKVKEKAEDFIANLKLFELFLNVVRGKVDIKNRLMLLLNPENIKTSTRLTRTEIDFVSLSHFVADEFPEFEGLRKFANLFCECSISREGWGVDSSIRLNSAISESKLMQKLAIFKGSEQGKEVKGKA